MSETAAMGDESMNATPTEQETIAPDSPTERRIRSRTLLEEVEENLAQSLLVFLIADLRLMSATGRISTKYQTIAIASDPPTRSTSLELAGLKGSLPKNQVSETLVKNMEEGLSPAQIMAVLIIELKKTVEARRAEEERKRAEGMVFPGAKRAEKEFKDDEFLYFEPDKKGNLKIRANEADMHSLLKAYADMIGEDLKADVPHITRRVSMLYSSETSSTQQPYQWPFSRLSNIVETGEDEDEESQNGQAANDSGGGQTTTARIARDAMQLAQTPRERVEALRQSILANPLLVDEETRTNAEFGEVTDALFAHGAEKGSFRVNQGSGENIQQQNLTKEELLSLMEKAVESREFRRLDFLADFFRDGSVSKLMAESSARVVWMNDWYPLKDLTYAIAVDKDKRRVLVVFRGAITKQDWARAVESRNLKNVENPIDEDYDDKSSTVDICSGFYQYLFRVRKDTGTTKYDEITNMVCEYGKERIGEKFHLVLTGHSLGGALSTVFSFFASADERFTRHGPVKCFNFGSPYVGGLKFQTAFHHQERQHKLIYARLFNHNDIGKGKQPLWHQSLYSIRC